MSRGFDRAAVIDLLRQVLSARPNITAWTLADCLEAEGHHGLTKKVINPILYASPRLFEYDEQMPPRWRNVRIVLPQTGNEPDAQPAREHASSAVSRRRPVRSRSVELWPWQREALNEWRAQGRRGIVEAVTGAGKTMLGLVAVHECLEAGGRALVLVPTIELQEQWKARLAEYLPGSRIGLMGGGRGDDLRFNDVVVSVVNSARARDLHPGACHSLLVADECHRYGAPRNAGALKDAFDRRLALTATVERSDDGHTNWLEPYFGCRCFTLGYRRALAEGVIAPFRVALVGVDLAPDEKAAYAEATDAARRLKRALVVQAGLQAEPFATFMTQVNELSRAGDTAHVHTARQFLKAFSDRRSILAETPSKLSALVALQGAIAAADSTLVFSESKDAAEAAATLIAICGNAAEAIHSGHDRGHRRDVLNRFRERSLRVVVAPRILDEGIDVPEADLGIVVATSKTRRQMVQRMGRILRKKNDGRLARFAVLYARETSEDPEHGDPLFRAHKEFLDEILDVAEDRRFFSLRQSTALAKFLAPAAPRKAVQKSVAVTSRKAPKASAPNQRSPRPVANDTVRADVPRRRRG